MTTQTQTPRLFSAADINALFAPPHPRRSSIEIFEDTRAILVDKRLAKAEMFDSFASRLPEDGTPFLLLPAQPAPISELDWDELMARIQLNGQTGRNYLTVSALSDLNPIITVPRVLVGVEDGRQRLNTKPSVAQADITVAGRFGYSLWEGYIHAVVYTEVLNHHYMDLIRSRCGSGYVPCLFLDVVRPKLYACWDDSAIVKWGAPSFGSVVEV